MHLLTGNHNRTQRAWLALLSIAGLAFVFLFQSTNISGKLGFSFNPLTQFIVNKSIRFLLNDMLVILLIYCLFWNKKYLTFSVYVQLAGTVLFLLPYFMLKIYYPSYNGPLLSFLHRLIINPVLLILLIPAFYHQEYLTFKNR
jgi:exosortase F-associated protein